MFVALRRGEFRRDLPRAFEAGLAESLLPRVKVYAENGYLIVSNHEELPSYVPESAAVDLALVLYLERLEHRTDSLNLIQRLLVDRGYQGLLPQFRQCPVAALEGRDGFDKQFLDLSRHLVLRQGLVMRDVLLQDIWEVAQILQFLQVLVDCIQFLDLLALYRECRVNFQG